MYFCCGMSPWCWPGSNMGSVLFEAVDWEFYLRHLFSFRYLPLLLPFRCLWVSNLEIGFHSARIATLSKHVVCTFVMPSSTVAFLRLCTGIYEIFSGVKKCTLGRQPHPIPDTDVVSEYFEASCLHAKCAMQVRVSKCWCPNWLRPLSNLCMVKGSCEIDGLKC